MDGILIIDKPAGLTSHDVVNRVRRVFKTKRVGHAGTLDPFATGVLVMLIGRATRLAKFLDKDEKEYEALVRFGFETDSGDRTGKLKSDPELSEIAIVSVLDSINWDDLLSLLRGEIQQVPPMHSAKKIAGKRLYKLAHKGLHVEREAVKVVISTLELVCGEGHSTVGTLRRFRVVCSAGTYIRTLAEDIGRAAHLGAHLEELRRTRSGRFTLVDSVTIDELEKLEHPESRLIPMGEALYGLPEIILPDNRIEKTRQGLSTRISAAGFEDCGAVKMLDERGCLAAVGIYHQDEKSVRPKVVLI